MRRVKVIFINVIVLTVTALLIRTIGISFQVYISNRIGPAGIGLFQLILSVYILALTIATSGIRLATTRLVAEELAKERETGAKKAVKACILYSVSFGIVISIILFLSADYIGTHWLSDKRTILSLRLLAFSLPFISMSSVFSGYFTAVRRAMKAASVQVVEQSIRIGVTILFLALFNIEDLEYACAAIIIGSCIGEILSFILLYLLYIRDSKYLKKNSGNPPALWPRMFHIALPVAFSAYVTSGIRTLQQILIPLGLKKSGSSNETALATYGTITGMVMPILMFPSAVLHAITDLIVPELTECQACASFNRLNYIVTRVFNLGMLSSVFVMLIFYRFSTELGLAIYSSVDAGYYIKILAPLIPIMYMDSLVDGMLKGLGEQVKSMHYNIIESIISTILIYLLLPRYAISGLIFTIFLGRALNFGLSLGRLLKIAVIDKGLGTVFKSLFAMVNSLVLANLLVHIISINLDIALSFYYQIPIVGIVYYLLLRALSCITDEDIIWFKALFR